MVETGNPIKPDEKRKQNLKKLESNTKNTVAAGRRLILTAICGMCFNAFSQDVITTVSGENIKAKVTEVTEETVSYKKYHDQDGATFVLKKEKITKIAWENGDVDEYGKTVAVEQNNAVSNPQQNLPFVEKRFGSFYLDNGSVYNEAEFKRFLMEQHLGSVWNQYSSAKIILTTGYILIGCGVGFELFFGVLAGIGSWNALFFAPTFLVLGILSGLAGIPTAIAGAVKKSTAISDYNSIYAGKPRPQYSQHVTYKIGLVGNGLGFSLNF